VRWSRINTILPVSGAFDGAAGAFIANPAGIFLAGLVALVLVVLVAGAAVVIAFAILVIIKLLLPMLLIVSGFYVWIRLQKPREGLVLIVVGLILFLIVESMGAF
jgi:hypothetical protein